MTDIAKRKADQNRKDFNFSKISIFLHENFTVNVDFYRCSRANILIRGFYLKDENCKKRLMDFFKIPIDRFTSSYLEFRYP